MALRPRLSTGLPFDLDRPAADLLALTATREAGVVSLGTTVWPELEALVSHPTLGPLARQLTWFTVDRALAGGPGSPVSNRS